MLAKMYLIDYADGLKLLGPYETVEARRRFYWELRDAGRQVMTLDTYSDGSADVGRHFREEER